MSSADNFAAAMRTWEQQLRSEMETLVQEALRGLRQPVEARLQKGLTEWLNLALQEASPSLLQRFQSKTGEWVARVPPPPPATEPWADWLAWLYRASQPTEVLQTLLSLISGLAPRCAVYVVRGNAALAWKSTGMRAPSPVPLEGGNLMADALKGAQWYTWTAENRPASLPQGLDPAATGGLYPLLVRGKAIGFVYWDTQVGGAEAEELERRVRVLTQTAGLVLQALVGQPKAPGAETPRPVGATPSAPPSTLPAAATAPAAAASSSTASASSAASPAAAPGFSTSPPPPSTLGAPEPGAAPPNYTSANGGAVSAPPAAASSGAPMSPLEIRAQRHAKVLMQDLELYLKRDRPQDLAEARQQRNVYTRLRADIDKCQQSYLEKFPPSSGISIELLEQQLVAVLCQGDAGMLGPGYNGLK